MLIMTTLLHRAALCGNIDNILQLIKEGSDLEAKNALGKTPLHCAATAGHADAVAVLLHHGADANAKTSNGKTPRFLAENGMRKNEWKKVIELLDAKINGKQTSLMPQGSKENLETIAKKSSLPLQEWSVEDVATWIASLEEGLFAPFCGSFREFGISGDILTDLADTGLESLGISNSRDREKLLGLISSLAKNEEDEYSDSERTIKRKAVAKERPSKKCKR